MGFGKQRPATNGLANNLCRSTGMSMQGDGRRRIAGGAEIAPPGGLSPFGRKPVPGLAMGLALCLALPVLAACGSIGPTLGPSVQTRDVSIAFESIDGLPRDISPRLVRDLNEEAAALRIAVVPAGGEASYHMRGYLAAHAEGSTTAVAWAWDVYDSELHRAFRLSGEERAGKTSPDQGRNGAMADDALLRQIARSGMEQLAGFMAAAPAPAAPAPPAPARNGSVVASRDDFRTGAALRFQGETTAALESAVPLPDRRPAWLADAASGR
jgi:hypothetical protein